MFRFLHILILNAWRGMRRANGTPAILITLIAVSVLFIGGNASARSSIQNVMHIVGLPVNAPAQPTEQISDNSSSKDMTSASVSNKKSTDTSKQDSSDSHSANKDTTSAGSQSALATESSNASVSLIPATVTPVCQQGVMLYSINAAQLSFMQPISGSGNITWSWETRIDSGSNTGSAPVSTTTHTVAVTNGETSVPIIPDTTSTTLLSSATNANYGYSVRLDITSPFTADSPWVSVPQSSSTTCP